jgi:hypothetical protein
LYAILSYWTSQNPKLQLGALAGHCEFCVQGVQEVPAVALSNAHLQLRGGVY